LPQTQDLVLLIPTNLLLSDGIIADPHFPQRVHNIDRAQYAGSFVIRTLATGHDGKEVEIGREPILSRWSVTGCKNCQSHLDAESLVPLDSELLKLLRGKGTNSDIKYRVVIQAHENGAFRGAPDGQLEGGEPIIDDL